MGRREVDRPIPTQVKRLVLSLRFPEVRVAEIGCRMGAGRPWGGGMEHIGNAVEKKNTFV